MKAFIRIMQLGNQFESYDYQRRIENSQEEDVFFEFDNFSDRQIINYSLELLMESESVSILIQMRKDAELGLIPFFFRKSLSQKDKIGIVCEGENEFILKILQPFKTKAFY